MRSFDKSGKIEVTYLPQIQPNMAVAKFPPGFKDFADFIQDPA